MPVSSQLLLFSASSLQSEIINPRNPRALYFNEDTYVGFVPGGKIEVISMDPTSATGSTIGGIVMNIKTGEVLSLVSLPDFNPNQEKKSFTKEQQNHMTSGVYELGSVIKAVTFAMAFDYGDRKSVV